MTPAPPQQDPGLAGPGEPGITEILADAVSAENLTQGLTIAGLLAGVAVAAVIAHAIIFFIAARAARRTPFEGDEILVYRLRGPLRVVFAVLAVQFFLPATEIPDALRVPLRHALSLTLILAITWMAVQLIRAGAAIAMARYDIAVADNLQARRIHTQLRVMARIGSVVVGVVGVGIALTTFPAIRQLGASILASAGIAGIVLGFASQKVLGNFIAGLQIAFAGPIHIDDVVVIDGEWGRVEEITTTYVVVRIWDQRRMIVPFSRIIDQSFTNWTRRESQILGTVYLHADYTVPIAELRRELERVVKDSPHWDGRVVGLVVTDAKAETLEIRALVSAVDGSKAWDLRCEVREKLVDFLQRNYPGSLPRTRVNLESDGDGPDADRPAPLPA